MGKDNRDADRTITHRTTQSDNYVRWCGMLKRLLLVGIAGLVIGGCGHGPAHLITPADYDLKAFNREPVPIGAVDIQHDVYIFPGPPKAPPVLLLHELPGLSPNTLYFAEYLSKHFNVYVPLLFGSPNQDSIFLGTLAYLFNNQWSEKENLQGSRPITQWVSAVIDHIKTSNPTQPIGVIGMCLTGAMPLSLLNHKEIKAVVLAQPTLPIFGNDDDLGISPQEWEIAQRRAAAKDIHVYGVRFRNDTIAARAKHCRLKRELGESVFLDREITAQEYCKKDVDNNYTNCPKSHSTLTYGWSKELPNDDPMNVRRAEVKEFLKNWLTQVQEGKNDLSNISTKRSSIRGVD